ncbi:beta-galactosidase [Plantibacter auratus]|uniref:beta-galactosidase n=1 Tax=Plantibacter auratus TaxID=272914 RepID=UPI003D35559C
MEAVPTATATALTVRHEPWAESDSDPAMSNAQDRHARVRLTSRSLLVDGKRVIPVSGEFHHTRVPRERWEERLRVMRAGGITVVAFYIIWIHHEEERGRYRFDGDRDVAAFVDLCAEIGLDVVLRIGPWVHGEVRNGGFPDWVQQADVDHRTDDPRYLALVETWFARLGRELAGRCGPSSHVIAIQIENELYDQPGHIRTLKQLARDAGLAAPIWTSTGWGGAELPEEEVLPLFGGYGDGFWVAYDAPWDHTFREHFYFSHVWDDPGIGADLRTTKDLREPRTPSPGYPAATCELGGGMATAYQRRPLLGGLDVAAVAHNKIGNGSAWQGYYMFVGGRNPVGTRSGLQESHDTGYPNDLPVFDYDFHAPIGATGRTTPAFAALRRQHAFLAAFGDRLAAMPSTLPDRLPDGVGDRDTLRWALRSDGRSGFVFITWHQAVEALDDHDPVAFDIALDDGVLRFPEQPVSIPTGTIASWPIGLDLDGVSLDWATATPLTVLDGRRRTLVLVAETGIPATLRFAEHTALESRTGSVIDGRSITIEADTPVVVTARSEAGELDVLVVPPRMADRVWALDAPLGVRLLLSDDPVWSGADGSIMGDLRERDVRPQEYRPEAAAFVPIGIDWVGGTPASPNDETANVQLTLMRGAGAPPPSYGEFESRASAPRNGAFARSASRTRLQLPPLDGRGARRRELEIVWAGDVARLVVDGIVRADRFWDGSPWIVDLDDIGLRSGSELVLEVLALHPEALVGLPADAAAKRAAVDGPLHDVGRVDLVEWYRWTEAGA